MITTNFLFVISLILLLTFLALVVRWYYIFLRYRKYLKQYPSVGRMPLLGYGWNVRHTTELYNTLLSSQRIFGKNRFEMIGFFPTMVTSDPNLCSKILGCPNHINKAEFYRALDSAIGKSLFQVNGNEWKRQRKLFNPLFYNINTIQYIDFFNKHSDNLVKILSDKADKKPIDMISTIEYFVMVQTFEKLFGYSLDKQKYLSLLESTLNISKIAMERITRPNEYFDLTYVFTKNFWAQRNVVEREISCITEALKKVQNDIEKNIIQKEDLKLVQFLLNEIKNKGNFTESSVIKQLALMFVAEFDTTALTICYVIYHLSMHPEIQQKTYHEILSILGPNKNQPVTLQNLKNMTYLELVIKESMRLTTTVPIVARKLQEDVQFEGSVLPKGLTIIFLIYVMHLDPELYTDPEKFIPERFSPDKFSSNAYSYLPFGGGVRNCIGQKQAMLSMKVTLAKLLHNYKFTDANHELKLSCELLLHSKNGVKVGIEKRQ